MKRVRYLRRAGLVAALAALGSGAVRGEDLCSRLDLTECGGEPAGRVRAELTHGRDRHLRFAIRPTSANAVVRVVFDQPASLAGKERLVIEGRSEESSGLQMCVARVVLLDAAGGEGAAYEPDLGLPPEWNQRTVLLSGFKGAMPEEVRGVAFHLWVPAEVGKECALHLRRCEFLSTADVAAALRPAARTPRARLRTRALPTPEKHRRWTNFGPGGGGWYRVVSISPHSGVSAYGGACFVGADVGGIYRSTDNCRTWRIVNSGVTNLYVNSIAFHPTDRRVIFAGTNGGVLKSADGGTTWSVKRRGFPPLVTFGESAPISEVAVDPVRPEVVYAGVGHERDFGSLRGGTVGGRIFKSTDGGETWRPVDLPGGEEARKLSVFCLRFHPRDRDRLYATTQGGPFTSADGGESWERLGTGHEGYLTTFLAVKRDEPEIMLLAYCRGPEGRGGVLKSADGGVTWRPTGRGLPAAEAAWRIVPHPRDTSTYYVGWHRRSGLFVTHDCGATWEPANTADTIRSAWFFVGATVTGIDIDPRNPDRLVYCNDMDLYQTLDGGKTWHQVATDLVRKASPEAAAVWRGRGCEVLCVGGPQALAVDPTNPRTLYFGYWDVHAWKSADGGKTCHRLTNGIDMGYGRMGCVVLDPADSRIVYISKGRNYDRHRIYKSVNAGGEFHLVGYEATGLPPGGVFNLVIDPESPLERRIVYATVTGYGVYRSEDGGLSWRERSDGLPTDSRMPKQLAMDPKNPGGLFLASGAHYHKDTRRRAPGYVARTSDGGERWEVVKSGIEPQCVVIDPFDSRKIYVGNRNFSGVDYPNAFYRSRDGGDTWTALDQTPFLRGPGSLDGDQGARVNLSCLAADPTRPGVLYAACRDHGYDVSNGRGVFKSTDGGETWRPFALDWLMNYQIGTLVLDPVDPSRLYVGTGGNGFFRFGPPPR